LKPDRAASGRNSAATTDLPSQGVAEVNMTVLIGASRLVDCKLESSPSMASAKGEPMCCVAKWKAFWPGVRVGPPTLSWRAGNSGTSTRCGIPSFASTSRPRLNVLSRSSVNSVMPMPRPKAESEAGEHQRPLLFRLARRQRGDGLQRPRGSRRTSRFLGRPACFISCSMAS
jgi:hypothetical protein